MLRLPREVSRQLRSRLRAVGCLGLVAVVVAWKLAQDTAWVLDVTALAGSVLGAVGLALRLSRLDEARLRDAMLPAK